MKSLEETIKQKCKCLGNRQTPYGLYNFMIPTNAYRGINIFLTDSNIETESIITLLEEMIPLFAYIYSCLKYHGCCRHTFISLNLKFRSTTLKFKDLITMGEERLENPIYWITIIKNVIESRGHYTTFSDQFSIEMMLAEGRGINEFLLEMDHEEENTIEEFTHEEEYEPEDEEDEEEEEEVINDTKTFKTENCIICIENGPNILFCNCGHLCICNNCLEFKKLSKCPVCKTENTILRIIE